MGESMSLCFRLVRKKPKESSPALSNIVDGAKLLEKCLVAIRVQILPLRAMNDKMDHVS